MGECVVGHVWVDVENVFHPRNMACMWSNACTIKVQWNVAHLHRIRQVANRVLVADEALHGITAFIPLQSLEVMKSRVYIDHCVDLSRLLGLSSI